MKSLGRHLELVRSIEREKAAQRAPERASGAVVVLGLGLAAALLVLTAWVDSVVRDRYGVNR